MKTESKKKDGQLSPASESPDLPCCAHVSDDLMGLGLSFNPIECSIHNKASRYARIIDKETGEDLGAKHHIIYCDTEVGYFVAYSDELEETTRKIYLVRNLNLQLSYSAK